MDFANNPFIELYAPPLIKKELKDKIETVLPKKCKKKNIDENIAKSKAIKIANKILSNIKIISDKKLNSWRKRAYELIGHRDINDIPFVTLALSLEAHGIITHDKDFNDQKIVKIWKVGKVKAIITEFSQGSFSFFILNTTIPLAFKICSSILITILKIITNIIGKIIEILRIIVTKGLNSLSKIPNDYLIILFLSSILGIIFLANKPKIINQIKEALKKLKNMLLKLIESVKNILKPLLSFVKFSIKAIGYLFYKTIKAINEIENLESYKPNNSLNI
ncbi:PIN domain-containing protein [Methanocaldococcus sp.]|uniref:PIN domain-containing protein n=1 Tax=Methanocaldococcus sp. TaxID=2152917 RepID=UPI00260FDE97|nr:PIN domain-containing protein [Methanocaldococcus sp.]MCQ6253846.1 PIN domain-containing protein [Methanocaldococcus sp.]